MKKDNSNYLAAVITDLHLKKENGELVKDIVKQTVDICKKREIKRIFIAGDIFTERSGQPLSCLSMCQEIFDYVKKQDISVLVIPGNHDKTDPDDVKSYLDFFRGEMEVFREGKVRLYNGFVVAFIPYFRDERWLEEYEKVEDIIQSQQIEGDIDDEYKLILITHSGFDGVTNNDGTKVESIIKPSMFRAWDKVLIGHYHNASKLAENVIYIGSAYQNNYGETIADKGCTLIKTDGELEFIPLKFPKYIKEVVDVNDCETLQNLLEKYEGESYDHIRFVFRGKKVDANKVDIAELAKKGIEGRFEAIETDEAMCLSETEEVLSYDKKSIMRDFMKFCSEQKIKGAQLKYGLNLIKSL